MKKILVCEYLYQAERYAKVQLSYGMPVDTVPTRSDLVDWHVFEAYTVDDFLDILNTLSGVKYAVPSEHNKNIPDYVLSAELAKKLAEEHLGRPLEPNDGDGTVCITRAGKDFDHGTHLAIGCQLVNETDDDNHQFYRTLIVSLTPKEIAQKKLEIERQTRIARKYALRRIETILKVPLNITARNYFASLVDEDLHQLFDVDEQTKCYLIPPTTLGNAMRIAMAPDGVAIPRLTPEHVERVQKFVRKYMSNDNLNRSEELYALWRKYADPAG